MMNKQSNPDPTPHNPNQSTITRGTKFTNLDASDYEKAVQQINNLREPDKYMLVLPNGQVYFTADPKELLRILAPMIKV